MTGADSIRAVERFCAAWGRLDFPAIAAALHDDVFYHNKPLQPIEGKPAVMAYLQAAGPFDACSWDLLHIAAKGNVVLTERVDRFVVRGVPVNLEVMGAFHVENGLIRQWRDYFDLAGYRTQWPS